VKRSGRTTKLTGFDYAAARALLDSTFDEIEQRLAEGDAPMLSIPEKVETACDTLFSSKTQSYREAVLGCVLGRIQDRSINIRSPYMNQGSGAFNGRTLDERVVNPFLASNRIPSSRGPYLNVFRRSVRFVEATRTGLRDKEGYAALLTVLGHLELTNDSASLYAFLTYFLLRFAKLRESANIPLSRLQRMSLRQYDELIGGLLGTPSGGRFPMLVAAAMFTAIKEYFGLTWEIAVQGINVADVASGVSGDITITSNGAILMAAEVTERLVDQKRVAATFNTKIVQSGIQDYLFLVRGDVDKEVQARAHQYFAQGHEVNFLDLRNWINVTLATIGKNGRAIFNHALLKSLSNPEIPQAVKAAWNRKLAEITGT
jgi:hypothetical protein